MGKNWGRWGTEDERGALNLIGPEQVRNAAARRQTGKVYSLAIPLTRESIPPLDYRPNPMRLTLTTLADSEKSPEYLMVPEGVGANEDVVQFSSHNGTHMDALCHVVSESKMYNGFPASSFLPTTGADRCGVQHNGTFAGPAKLLDVLAFRGADGLPAGHPIDAELLEATRVAQGTTIDPGDILLVRTGWITHRGRDYGPDQGWFQPGLNLSSVDFIDQYDISAVGVDNTAVEVLPFDGWKYLCVHIELLVNRGVTLMEHLWLEDLAADKAYDLLLAVGALPITGASGGPINPIAIA